MTRSQDVNIRQQRRIRLLLDTVKFSTGVHRRSNISRSFPNKSCEIITLQILTNARNGHTTVTETHIASTQTEHMIAGAKVDTGRMVMANVKVI